MGDDWRPIETAPRDGTEIEVTDQETFWGVMRWNVAGFNPLVSKDYGIWECPGGNFTWCEDDGFGPTHWRPLPTRPQTREG